MLGTTLGFRLHKEGDFVFRLTTVSFSRPLYHKVTVRYIHTKSKVIPLQAWTGPEGSRRLRLPDFKTIGT
jgi:hypothetical protein